MLIATALPAQAAPSEIGHLLRAYPIAMRTSPFDGTSTTWACEYQVGNAVITTTITTKDGTPPCKLQKEFQ